MTVAERFHRAWIADVASAISIPELLPDRLSRACLDVLPVAGAGITIMDVLRVPVGASDRAASVAERVQSTAGEGPCLLAHASRRPVVATESIIRHDWPAFYDGFVTHTPYRSAASLPLSIGAAAMGALDLYFERPEEATALSLDDAGEVAEQISAAMSGAPSVVSPYGVLEPTWLSAPAAVIRLRVWQAIGRISVALALDAEDALSVLRAHAYADDRDLDDVAADVVSGRLPAGALNGH